MFQKIKSYKKNTQINVDVSKKDKGIISRGESLRRRLSAIKKQKRDIEQMVTLSEAYSIIHLCAGEVLSRGLGEENLFSPVESEDNPDEVRYLINCLLRDNRTEFEDELKFQDIRNVVAGIRWTLRKCVTNVVSYKDYQTFVRLESGIFSKFVSNLSKASQAILLELFELFSQVMTHAHINKIPAQRIIKSMAHFIIGDKELKFENFSAAYTKWLRCSNACTHLYLAYLRERACSASLPPRLNILLDGYVQFRKKSRFSPDYQHPLADITIEDLQLIIRPKKQRQKNPRQFDSMRSSGLSRQVDLTKNSSSTNGTPHQSILLNNGTSRGSGVVSNNNGNVRQSNVTISNRQTNSTLLKSMLKNGAHESVASRGSLTIAEMFPDIAESLESLRRKTAYQNLENIIEDSNVAAQKWDELQIKGFNVLSEEALKLFFSYDDRTSNPCASIVRKRSRKRFNKKTFDERFLEMIPNIEINRETIRDTFYQSEGNNSRISMRTTVVWDEFEEKGFRDSLGTNSNLLSLCSTLGKSSVSIPISELTEATNTDITNTDVTNPEVINPEVINPEIINTEVTNSEINEPQTHFEEEIRLRTQERSRPINRQGKRKNNKIFRKTICFLCLRPGSGVSGFSVTMETDEDQDETNPMNSHVTIEPINNNFPYMWVESSANVRNEKEPWEWVFVEPRDERHEREWIMFEDKGKFLSEREKEKEKRKSRKKSLLNTLNTMMPWSKSNRRNNSDTIEFSPQEQDNDYDYDDDSIIGPNKFINKINTSGRPSPTGIISDMIDNGEGDNDNNSTYSESRSPNVIKRNILSLGYDNISVSSLAFNQEQYNEQSYVLASRRLLQTQQYPPYRERPSYQMPVIQPKKPETNREREIKFW
ncbi:12805_t:CDS:2 [Dentiscutata erythropus]|uniref:12805_t:CDS:1 n=1 Tax=Dentiscutata erythropus TaxID=1348616 RepID=A0A9N9BQQ6_9GLOM|nr:12805_t:CDS:2 [Dentiscutata erythropus]